LPCLQTATKESWLDKYDRH